MQNDKLDIVIKKKLYLRIIPFLFVIYIFAFLDRVNISFAALTMNKELGFSDAVYGFGAGIFFIGYFLFEIPGTIIMERWSARLWIARILLTWGLISGAMAFVQTEWQFYLARFLLGVAEASFMPGVIYYLSCWFREEDRARTVALFMTALPVCSVIGSPLSTYLLGFDWLGVAGWKWLFVIEAVPSIVLGFITPFYLIDRPQEAVWLSAAEKKRLSESLAAERNRIAGGRSPRLAEIFVDRAVIMLCGVYFFWICGFYGFNMWLPIIVKGLSATLSNFMVGCLISLLYLGALLGMVFVAWHSDKTKERRCHAGFSLIAGGLALAASVLFADSAGLSLLFFAITAMGIYGGFGPYWSIPPSFLTGTAAAAAIALINSTGNLGGFVGPYVVGYIKTTTGSFYGGVIFLVGCLLAAGLLVLLLPTRKQQTE